MFFNSSTSSSSSLESPKNPAMRATGSSSRAAGLPGGWPEQEEESEQNLLQLSTDDECDERDLTVDKTAIKRVAILDTCNLLFQCGRYSLDTKMTRQIGLNEKMGDAIGILLLTRKLLKEGFDVKMFIPDSYLSGPNRSRVRNQFILEELRSLGLLTRIREGSHDDLLMVEYAKCTGGFIISEDRYRDHAAVFETRDEDALRVIRERVVRIRFREFPVDRLKHGARALAKPGFMTTGYLGVDCTLVPRNLKAMYSWHGLDDYEFVAMNRANRSQRSAEIALEELDVMCEYFRLYFCELNGVQAEKLPWWDPARGIPNPDNFLRFWKHYQDWAEEEADRKMKLKRQQQQGK